MGFQLESIKALFETHCSDSRIDILKQQLELAQQHVTKYQKIVELLETSIENEMKGQLLMKQKDKFENLEKYDDSLKRTLSNLTIIFSKLFLFSFLILGLMLIFYHVRQIIIGEYIWGSPVQSIIVSGVFVALGLFITLTTARILFFTKTKDLLKTINEPYRKSKK